MGLYKKLDITSEVLEEIDHAFGEHCILNKLTIEEGGIYGWEILDGDVITHLSYNPHTKE